MLYPNCLFPIKRPGNFGYDSSRSSGSERKGGKSGKRVAAFESDSEKAPAVARAAIEYAAANPPPVEEKSRNKWYENLRVELQNADVLASGNWVKPESWKRIETKMTPEEVIAILGEPTASKLSVR